MKQIPGNILRKEIILFEWFAYDGTGSPTTMADSRYTIRYDSEALLELCDAWCLSVLARSYRAGTSMLIVQGRCVER